MDLLYDTNHNISDKFKSPTNIKVFSIFSHNQYIHAHAIIANKPYDIAVKFKKQSVDCNDHNILYRNNIRMGRIMDRSTNFVQQIQSIEINPAWLYTKKSKKQDNGKVFRERAFLRYLEVLFQYDASIFYQATGLCEESYSYPRPSLQKLRTKLGKTRENPRVSVEYTTLIIPKGTVFVDMLPNFETYTFIKIKPILYRLYKDIQGNNNAPLDIGEKDSFNIMCRKIANHAWNTKAIVPVQYQSLEWTVQLAQYDFLWNWFHPKQKLNMVYRFQKTMHKILGDKVNEWAKINLTEPEKQDYTIQYMMKLSCWGHIDDNIQYCFAFLFEPWHEPPLDMTQVGGEEFYLPKKISQKKIRILSTICYLTGAKYDENTRIVTELRTEHLICFGIECTLEPQIKVFTDIQDGVLYYEWRVAVGDDTLTPDAFIKAIHENKWIVDTKTVNSIVKKIAKPPPRPSRYELIRASRVPGNVIVTHNAAANFDALLQIDPHELPPTFSGTLHAHQIYGYHWLVSRLSNGFGAILADDMGLGKTVQSIVAMLHLQCFPCLIVCPKVVLLNWKRELTTFAPTLTVGIIHGQQKQDNANLDKCQVLLTTYGMVKTQAVKNRAFDLVCLDEAQHIKNQNTQSRSAVAELNCQRILALTGTPVENNVTDLWSIGDIVLPGYLGKNLRDFSSTFKKRPDLLGKIIAPFLLRRRKSDPGIADDLPEKMILDISTHLSATQASLYQSVLNEKMSQIKQSEGIQRRGIILATITALKQICNHTQNYNSLSEPESGKLNTLRTIIDDNQGKKMIVFSQYTTMVDLLIEWLNITFPNTHTASITGKMSTAQRESNVNKFQTDPTTQFIVISLAAGGTGINLIAAETVVMFDLWWNPARENQAIDRAYRIGQTSSVMVYRFITMGTFEEKVNEILTQKKELSDTCVDTVDMTSLDNTQLEEIFEMSWS